MKTTVKAGEYTLSPQEVKVIIHSCNSFRNRVIIEALYYAGLRREEATKLEIRDISFQRRNIIVRIGKGGKSRTVPFIDFGFMGDLKHLIGKRLEGKVFIKSDGTGLSPWMINKIVKKAGELSGLKNPHPFMTNINPHIFRHSIARHLKSKDFSTEWVQKFLGHSSFKTTMDTYGTLGFNEMQAVSDRKFGLIEDKSLQNLPEHTSHE